MSIVADHSAELLATKDDIARLERRIAELRHELKNELHSELRAHMRYTLATMVAMTGVFSVIVGLIT